ncbi:MAG: type II toxin-antitoxin system HicB family antitoxin [Timaviella obliquedivisa GSE-PSE-MK23-08B]|jgi:predicted RNase H-like HicB family nuclease|nr:type II toxin-antitoxin system HicB family antitoxin [Timaviella obliquedivisa GSE-PSE-MK23-08B]
MRSLRNYTIVLRPDDNGTFVAYVPAVAGCHAWGQTPEEAQAELVHVFEMIRDEQAPLFLQQKIIKLPRSIN